MALIMSTAEALRFLLAISACLSVVHGAYDTAGPSEPNVNSTVRSGLIRNQGPNANADFPLTGSRVSSSASVPDAGSVSGNLGGSTSRVSSTEFARSGFGANLGVSSGSLDGRTDSGLRPGVIAASADQALQRILNVPGSFGSGAGPATVLESALNEDFHQEPVSITQETTVDVFKTISNIIYNSVPVTLTEFIKTTEVAPTLQVISTPVDDRVFVATAPVAFTQTVTVTNTNTVYLYATEVSTDVYTVTHKAYEIRQKLITSTIQQTQVFRPTIVRTRINTEYDTQTVEQTVFNTIVIQPRTTLPLAPSSLTLSNQQFAGQGQQFVVQRQEQQNLFVRNAQFPDSGRVIQQTSRQVSSADQQIQQLLNLQLPEQDVRQFPVLGRDGQPLAGQGQRQQNLFVRNSQTSGSDRLVQQTSGQVLSADQQISQLLNLQLPEQDVRQFPILGRDGQQVAGQGQQFAGQGQGQQNSFVRNSLTSGNGRLGQTPGVVSRADQQSQQLFNLQLPEQDVGQFPILGRDGQQLAGEGQQFAGQGQGQQNLLVRNSQTSGNDRLVQTPGLVSRGDQQSQQLLNLQLPEQDVGQFPILGRDGQPLAGQGQGQQNLLVRNSQAPGSGRQIQQTSGKVLSADQLSQQLLNLQLPEQDVRQFPILGRDGQQLAGDGQGQQNLFVRN